MFPSKLVRLLVLGESINNPFLSTPNHHQNPNQSPKSNTETQDLIKTKHPFLLFTPTRELITDTYRLATLSRLIGLNLYPNPSLSHIIFSWPSHSTSSSPYLSLPNNAVPLPFPSLKNASLTHLRCFVGLSKGFFKIVFSKPGLDPVCRIGKKCSTNWDCCSVFLVSRRNGARVDSMEGFCRVLAGAGWTFYKTNDKKSSDSGDGRVYELNSVYLFRKMDLGRVRELRLPLLDFINAPLRILQYILLMTDDVFYLA